MLTQIYPAAFEIKEKLFKRMLKQKQHQFQETLKQKTDKLNQLKQFENHMLQIKSLVTKYEEKKMLTEEDKNRFLHLLTFKTPIFSVVVQNAIQI